MPRETFPDFESKVQLFLHLSWLVIVLALYMMNFLNLQFRPIFEYMRLYEAKEDYEYWLSPQSLQLHEEYESRVEVLKQLGYINGECLGTATATIFTENLIFIRSS